MVRCCNVVRTGARQLFLEKILERLACIGDATRAGCGTRLPLYGLLHGIRGAQVTRVLGTDPDGNILATFEAAGRIEVGAHPAGMKIESALGARIAFVDSGEDGATNGAA